MSDKEDYSKLIKFTEAAVTNPLHPVYKLGLQQSPMLKHYAINVMQLGLIEANQWFKEYPEYTASLNQVMALCESDDLKEDYAGTGDATTTPPVPVFNVDELKAEMKDFITDQLSTIMKDIQLKQMPLADAPKHD